jgi:predicted outer membrane protein
MAARKKAAEASEHARSLAAEVDRVDRELQTLRRRSDRAAKDASTASSRLEDAEQGLQKAQSDLDAEA